MEERIEKIEDELNIVKYKFELLEQFFKSDTEKTESLKLLVDTHKDYVIDTDRRIKSLEDSVANQRETLELMNKTIESQVRSIKMIMSILE